MANKFRVNQLVLSGRDVTTLFYSSTNPSGFTNGEINTASNLGGASGLFSQKIGPDLQFKSISVGTGLTITGSSSRLNISTFFGTNFSSGLVVNKSITQAGTFVTAISGDFGPGTYLAVGQACISSNAANSGLLATSKLWSGAGAFVAVSASTSGLGAQFTGFLTIPMVSILTLTAVSTPVVVSCASNVVNSVILASPPYVTAGLLGSTTKLDMVRLY